MANRGSITLGEVKGKLTMLEVACHRCERRGRVSLARLIEDHGAIWAARFVGKPRGRLPERAHNGAEQPLRHLLSAVTGAVSAGQGNLTPMGAAVALYGYAGSATPILLAGAFTLP